MIVSSAPESGLPCTCAFAGVLLVAYKGGLSAE